MTEPNPIIKNLRESTGIRIAILFGSFFVFLLFCSVAGYLINNAPGSERSHLLIMSSLQCILAFCLPAVLVAKFSNNDWIKWLEIDRKPKIKSFLGIIVLYIISLPAMEWLIEWNSSLHLPESMSGIESQLRAWEESAESTTQMLLDSHGWLSVLVGVCVIGILTGFSEELFFRGGLQGIFTRSAINKNAAVWMAAMIFSLMHFQFFGFLPRLLMGAFFGYLLLWTRSIWVPAFAHILNNSIVVISSYLTGNSEDSILELNEMPTFLNGSVSACISLILTILFFIYLRDILFKTSKEEEKGWQRSQLPVSTER